MTKFFKKTKKTYFGAILSAFLPKFGPKMNFPGEKEFVSFSIFKLSTIVPKIRKT